MKNKVLKLLVLFSTISIILSFTNIFFQVYLNRNTLLSSTLTLLVIIFFIFFRKLVIYINHFSNFIKNNKIIKDPIVVIFIINLVLCFLMLSAKVKHASQFGLSDLIIIASLIFPIFAIRIKNNRTKHLSFLVFSFIVTTFAAFLNNDLALQFVPPKIFIWPLLLLEYLFFIKKTFYLSDRMSVKHTTPNKILSIKLVVLVVTLIFSLRYILSKIMPIDLDEGIHLYDSHLINNGNIVFYDFLGREPIYLYILATFTKFFGYKLEISRLLSILFMIATTIPIYYIGKEIYNKKIAIISVLFYSSFPFFIENTIYGNLYAVYPFFIAINFLLLVKYLKTKNEKLIIPLGLMLGLTTHVYRLNIFYFPFIGTIMGLKSINKKDFFALFLSLSLTFLFPIIYYSNLVGYKNFDIIYGSKYLVVSLFSLPISYLFFITYKNKTLKLFKKKYLADLFFILLIFSLLFLFVKSGLSMGIKAQVIAESLVISSILFVITLYTITSNLQKITGRNYVSFVLYILFLILIIYNFFTNKNTQILDIKNINVLVKIFSIQILFSFYLFIKKINLKISFLELMLLIPPLFFYIIQVQIFTNFLLSTIVISSLIVGKAIYELNKRDRKLLFILLIFIFVIYISTSINFKNRNRALLPQNSREEIENYIYEKTKNNDVIFTMANLYVVETDRKLVFDISRLSPYAQTDVYMPSYINTSKNMKPLKELNNEISNNVSLILLDNRLKNFSETDDFKNILKENFVVDKVWDNYEITSFIRK